MTRSLFFLIVLKFLHFVLTSVFVQLLLCVGEFFGTTPEAEAEWQQYKTGAKKGTNTWINQL